MDGKQFVGGEGMKSVCYMLHDQQESLRKAGYVATDDIANGMRKLGSSEKRTYIRPGRLAHVRLLKAGIVY